MTNVLAFDNNNQPNLFPSLRSNISLWFDLSYVVSSWVSGDIDNGGPDDYDSRSGC
jgi:hypothetical protein